VLQSSFLSALLMGMNFDTTEAAAAQWMESHEDFQLLYADKSENQLQFACSRLRFPSFFIVCPSSVDGNWVCVVNKNICRIHIGL